MNVKNARLWSRRSVLQSLALGAGGLTTMAAAQRDLRAAGLGDAPVATPKRLLVVFSPNGIPERQGWPSWLVNGTGENDYKTTPITAPLERHRKDVVFFDNLILASPVKYGDKHHTAARQVLSGWRIANLENYGREKSGGPSVDQFLADKIGKIATPQWPSLELVAQEGDTYVSWSAAGTVVPAIADPMQAFGKLFAALPSGGAAAAPDPAIARRLAVRKSVLDSVSKDLAAFQKRLPAEDRARADAQLDVVRTLEKRLVVPAAPGAKCGKPMLLPINAKDTKQLPQVIRAHGELAVAAFACDLTRICMLNIRGGVNRLACDFDPVNHAEEEHTLSHDYQDKFALFKTLLNEEIAHIADRLKAIPEGDGSMLDNTIILQITEISRGHQHGRMPWYSLGGKNMGVRVGRLLALPKEINADANDYGGYPHQKLFVSLIHAMGARDVTSFGAPEYGQGPMTGYLG